MNGPLQMNLLETHTAIIQKTPLRMQEYGVGIFTTITTKTALKKALKQERILVDGKVANSATFISGNEIIALKAPEVLKKHRLFNCPLQVIYEDDYLAAIYKPAGILVSGNSFKTIDNALAQNLRHSTQKDAVQPHPVHRLDYPTTGILLIGKTASCMVALNQLFEKKEIEKTYTAVTIGAMGANGLIEEEIDAKVAISHYEVLQTVPSARFQYLNLVQLRPETGRRHQLRRHLLSIGNPILGDATYCNEGLVLKGKGLYLHAQSLSFKHPITFEAMHLETPLPTRFNKLFK